MPDPTISIVTATYNSSHLLRFAISSVLRSSCQDWELLIIGDHCTDDSAAVVSSFNDRRIHFTNLRSNSGQQATPNNVGVARARGEYLCFLNQDDMFLPWHLSSMIAELHRCEADIICARYIIVMPPTGAGDENIRAINGGASESRRGYSPERWHVASSWFMPLLVARQVGSWNTENETYVTPSQDWLFRAWKSGKRIHCTQSVSLIAVPSGQRKGFYRQKDCSEHQFIYEHLVVANNLLDAISSIEKNDTGRSAKQVLLAVYNHTIGKLLLAFGIHPNTLGMMIRYGRRGGFVRNWKRRIQ